jgi:hypothetical protein
MNKSVSVDTNVPNRPTRVTWIIIFAISIVVVALCVYLVYAEYETKHNQEQYDHFVRSVNEEYQLNWLQGYNRAKGRGSEREWIVTWRQEVSSDGLAHEYKRAGIPYDETNSLPFGYVFDDNGVIVDVFSTEPKLKFSAMSDFAAALERKYPEWDKEILEKQRMELDKVNEDKVTIR